MIRMDFKTILVLLLLAVLAGMLIEPSVAAAIQSFFASVGRFFAPVANAINSTSDASICNHTGNVIGGC